MTAQVQHVALGEPPRGAPVRPPHQAHPAPTCATAAKSPRSTWPNPYDLLSRALEATRTDHHAADLTHSVSAAGCSDAP
jgi:hypothetical protein